MNNLKYSLKTLINNPFLIFLSLVQFTVIFLFIIIIFNIYYMINGQTKALEEVFKDKEYYGIQDMTDEDILFDQIFKKEDARDNLREFYEFLINNERFDFIQFLDGNLLIEPIFEIDEKNSDLFYSQNTPTLKKRDKDYSLLKRVGVGKNFFQKVGIDVLNNFENENQVILGHKYRDYINLNDKITVFDYDLDAEVKKEVVGFLDKNTYFFSRSEGLILLDEYIIEHSSINKIPEDKIITYVDAIINGSFIESEDIDNAFDLINDKSIELGLYTKLLPLNMEEQSNALLHAISHYRNIVIPAIICIIIFAFISITISLLNLIRRNFGEIAVHLAYGARIRDINIRYLIINALLIIMPFSISMLVSNLLVNSMLGIPGVNTEVLIALVFVLILFFLGISILPIKYIKRIELTKILKQEYSL